MDKRVSEIAALANVSVYNDEATADYLDGAPHIKHAPLRELYGSLVVKVFDRAREHAATPLVLDLGAGEGSVTLPFLQLGAHVVAVDISRSQLDTLEVKCKHYGTNLEVRCEDINVFLQDKTRRFDVIVVNSFLHHVPDYCAMIKEALPLLNPGGQFFSFHDPLRYDSLGTLTSVFSKVAYFSWRVTKGDVIEGLKRRLRRARGVYIPDSPHDNAEYHVTRNGVDQDAIRSLFEKQKFECEVITYFSTQSSLFQPIGTALGMKTQFGVIARKP